MASKSYNSINYLFADLEKDIEEIVSNPIKDKVIEMAQDSVQENVLDVYTPKVYKRRSGHNSGGLKDTWVSDTIVNNDKITLTGKNSAKPINSEFGDLAENIEEGYEKKDKEWNRPRPFISKAQEKIDNSDIIENTLVEELKNRGW